MYCIKCMFYLVSTQVSEMLGYILMKPGLKSRRGNNYSLQTLKKLTKQALNYKWKHNYDKNVSTQYSNPNIPKKYEGRVKSSRSSQQPAWHWGEAN